MSGTLPQEDSSSGSFIQNCHMLYLSATAAPLVNSFLVLKMRKSNILDEFLVRQALPFSNHCIATRYKNYGSGFLLSMFNMKNTITKATKMDANPIHAFWLLLIGTRTGDGLIVYLFTQLNETKRKKQNKGRHIQKIVLFCCSVLYMANWKSKICITDYIYIFLFGVWIRKRNLNYPFPIFYNGIGKRKRKDGI